MRRWGGPSRTAPRCAGVGPHPGLGAGRHRPGRRVRLRRDPGLPGAPGGGRPDDPRELEPGDDHDRPVGRRRRLPRAADRRGGRGGHRPRATRGAARRAGRPDGAQPGGRPRPGRRPRASRRPAHRHAARGDRDGRGSRALPRPPRPDRPAVRAVVDRRGCRRGRARGLGRRGPGRDRPARRSSARPSPWAGPVAGSSRRRRPTASGSGPACGRARSARSWWSAASSAGRRSSTR